MIICPNCGKENQDHYKFCLGCGARLPGGAPASVPPRASHTPAGTQITPPVAPQTSGGTVIDPPKPPAGKAPAPATSAPSFAAATPPAEAAQNGCNACGMVNPQGFLFCGRCGNRLSAAPVTPPPAAVPPPITARPSARPKLRAALHLLREDGSDGGTIDLEDGPIPFGRDSGPPFDQDFYLNPKHCAFTVEAEGVRVDDLSPVNGVYRKIEGRIELQHGDTFRVGQELLYYEDLPEAEALADGTERMGSPNPGYWGRISVIVDGGRACEAVPIVGNEFIVGRERGDLTFPTDGYVSSTHCRIGGDDEGVFLEDRGSSNGTYLRVRSGQCVPFGSLLLIGQQLFHVRQS
ncbi:Forkhead associated (FHA) domain, binds pSer, pThr, pTyr [Nannocystis exedens]|uniref:Forkhead associated (FHA) domain, binds pSer, pThr, pTyr n=1 Tax=Nannocystis exedens TaxID=54 RepID=A0A1I1TAR1_9BACT|nr:FHA domain-containing protein [Nannocystis exedens]PCC66675.1 phosphopeptide-binding protein [Nannocystis exedens]SFD55722.1 Forkhead associated (FHA) domain, binds pSer, pThr, pTyr [Nannocystis exedens]